MDFLLSWNGLLYNGPALCLLAYLLWLRPAVGTVVAGLAGLRVLGPIAGLDQWIPFSVHMTLVGVAALAWASADGPIGLDPTLVAGALVVGLQASYVYLAVWAAPTPWGTGLLVGVGLAGLQRLGLSILAAAAPSGVS
jgi:hypothetical protein